MTEETPNQPFWIVGDRYYNSLYEEIDDPIPDYDLSFPVPQDYHNYQDYKNAAQNWEERAESYAENIHFELPIWGTIKKPQKPYIDTKYPNRIPNTFLGPANQLDMEKKILTGEEFDIENGNFPVEGRFKKMVQYKGFFNNTNEDRWLIPEEPFPDYYDTYDEYKEAVENWTRICERIKEIPEHPKALAEKVVDLEKVENCEGTPVPDKFLHKPKRIKVRSLRKRKSSVSHQKKKKNTFWLAKYKKQINETFLLTQQKIVFNVENNVDVAKTRGIYFPIYPNDFITKMIYFGDNSSNKVTGGSSNSRVMKLISYSIRSIQEDENISFKFDKIPRFNDLFHEIKVDFIRNNPGSSLYLWSLINYIFSSDQNMTKKLIKDDEATYLILKLILKYSNSNDDLIDPMFDRFDNLIDENEDHLVEMFYRTLVRGHFIKLLMNYCNPRKKIYDFLYNQLSMESITHNEALNNLLGKIPEQFITWMQKAAKKDPTFLGGLFKLLLSSDNLYLDVFFNRFNTENDTIFNIFKKISQANIKMFYELTVMIIYRLNHALIIYKMFSSEFLCHSLIDCLSLPIVNFMTTLLQLEVSKSYIPIQQLAFLIYQIPKLSPETSTVPQITLFNSLCELLYREIDEKIVSEKDAEPTFTGTLLMIENLINISKSDETLQIALYPLNLFIDRFNCEFFFTNPKNIRNIISFMASDSETISYTSWNIFTKWLISTGSSFQTIISKPEFKAYFENLLKSINPLHYLSIARTISEIANSNLPNNAKQSFFSMFKSHIDIKKLSNTLHYFISKGQIPYYMFYINKFDKTLKEHSSYFKQSST